MLLIKLDVQVKCPLKLSVCIDIFCLGGGSKYSVCFEREEAHMEGGGKCVGTKVFCVF